MDAQISLQVSGELNPIPEQNYSYSVKNYGGNYQYHWVVYGGNDCYNCGPSHTVTWDNVSSGSIQVTIVSQDNEYRGSGWLHNVRPKYLGTPSITPTNVGCGEIPTFTAKNATNADVYTWTLPSGTYVVNGKGNNKITPSSFPINSSETVSVTVTRDDAPNFSVTSRIDVSRPLPEKPIFTQYEEIMCSGESTTFSASGVNADTYTWTTTGGVRVNGSTSYTGNGSVSVSGTSSGTISVRSNSTSCDTTSSDGTKSIFVGDPVITGSYVNNGSSGYPSIVCGSYARLKLNTDGATSYNWTLVSNTSGTAFLNGYNNEADVSLSYGTSGSTTIVDGKAINSCGSTTRRFIIAFSECYSSYMVSPNPASTELAITFDEPTSEEELPEEIILVSEKAKKVKEIKPKKLYKMKQMLDNKKLKFDVQKLPRGLYFLHVIYKDKVERHQIVLK